MTQIYWNEAALAHVTPPGHPERVARAEAVHAALVQVDSLDWRDAEPADRSEVERCHPAHYVDRIAAAVPAQSYASLFTLPEGFDFEVLEAEKIIRTETMQYG